MNVKLLELRDRATFIAILAIDLSPADPPEAERYLLRRCGYACDGWPTIGLARLDANGQPFRCDPYDWGDRTFQVAHIYITEYWAELKSGDVVDVEYILCETKRPKESERMSYPV